MSAILLKSILFATLIFGVKSKIDYTYDDKIAYTVTLGLECINNCVHGKCIVDETLDEHNCKKTHINALVHRTIHDKVCLSRCYEVEGYTGKCYISQDGDWDYCESSKKVDWIRDRAFTDSNGPCKDTCRWKVKKSRPTCNHFWSGFDNCDPEWGANYIQARTITGKLCRGMCSRHLGRDYTWCAHTMRDEEACAIPGMPRPIDWSDKVKEIMAIKKPICIRVKDLEAHKAGCDQNKEDIKNGVFERFVQDLESNPDHDTWFRRNNLYSITSATTKDGIYDSRHGYSKMPIVVRAVIHPRHLDSSENEDITVPYDVSYNLAKTERRSGDIAGYIVRDFMGGTQEKFNIYNRKSNTSYDENEKIVRFLDTHKHLLDAKVDLVVAALYREGNSRPVGILRRVKFYHTNSLMDVYYEYLPNEDDEEDYLPSSIGELSLLPPVDFNQERKDSECYISGFADSTNGIETASTTENALYNFEQNSV